MLMSSQGQVLRCDVNGKVVMKVFLSGMPDVKLGLNDALEVQPSMPCCQRRKQDHRQPSERGVLTSGLGASVRPAGRCLLLGSGNKEVLHSLLAHGSQRCSHLRQRWHGRAQLRSELACWQDVTFHQCVNLGKFNTEKVVSFVPPDGEFELMKYRCQEGIKQPFKVGRHPRCAGLHLHALRPVPRAWCCAAHAAPWRSLCSPGQSAGWAELAARPAEPGPACGALSTLKACRCCQSSRRRGARGWT